MSYVSTSNGKRRPSWNYKRRTDDGWPGYDSGQLEMLESIRNVCEQIRDALQGIRSCSTVHKAMRDIDEIRKNTTKRRRKAKP